LSVRSLRRLRLALAALPFAACAAIPWPHTAWPPPRETDATGWRDLRGVVHVHTEASHDSPGTLDAVLAAARASGIAWVALSEHTRPGRLGPYGRFDDVTVLPGFEASAAGGSLLALGVRRPPPRTKDPAALVRFARDAGGVAFVGHLERSRLGEPEAFRAAAPDGVELVSLHANSELRRASLAWRVPLLPSGVALRTLLFVPEANLARWQALPGPPPIVGAVDAHAKMRLLGPGGGTVDRYRDVFRLLTTHVWAAGASEAEILAALAAGRSYVAFEGLGRVDRFRFAPEGVGFRLEAPRAAELALVCGGAAPVTAAAASAWLPAPPGARRCRAEARLDGRLWILTSPRDLPMTTP
jgi:hypothetical protein